MYIIIISVNIYNFNVNIYKRSVIAFILVFKELSVMFYLGTYIYIYKLYSHSLLFISSLIHSLEY